MKAIFAFAALCVASPAVAQRTPDMEAIYQYGQCVGATSGATDLATGSVDVAIKVAFQNCAPERGVAVNEVTKALVTKGLVKDDAGQHAESLMQQLEGSMATKLRSDIAAFRAKKQD